MTATLTPLRICPSCASRPGGLVDGACPVCEGAGALALGPLALSGVDPVEIGVVIGEDLAGVDDDTAAELVEDLLVDGFCRRLPQVLAAS